MEPQQHQLHRVYQSLQYQEQKNIHHYNHQQQQQEPQSNNNINNSGDDDNNQYNNDDEFIDKEQQSRRINKMCIYLTKQQCNIIRKQTQFYLSPINLITDQHLNKQLHKNSIKNKWLPLSYLMSCKKISNILQVSMKDAIVNNNNNKDNKDDVGNLLGNGNNKMVDEQLQYQVVGRGSSRRSKIRVLGRVLGESGKLIVKGNKVRTIQTSHHVNNVKNNDRNKSNKSNNDKNNVNSKNNKTNDNDLKNNPKNKNNKNKNTNTNKNNIKLSQNQKQNILYIQLTKQQYLQPLIQYISSSSTSHNNMQKQYKQQQQQQYQMNIKPNNNNNNNNSNSHFHIKISQISRLWLLILFKNNKIKQQMQQQLLLKDNMDKYGIRFIIGGAKWEQYSTIYTGIRKQINKHTKNIKNINKIQQINNIGSIEDYQKQYSEYIQGNMDIQDEEQ